MIFPNSGKPKIEQFKPDQTGQKAQVINATDCCLALLAMSYNPYANFESDPTHSRLHQPQPLHAGQNFVNQQQQFQPQQPHPPQQQAYNQFQQPPQGQSFGGNAPNSQFNQFFNDPAAAMTFQVGQNAMMAGSQLLEQNVGKYVKTSEIKYYFKVSNSYVLSKLLLILFPFGNKTWTRTFRGSNNANDQSDNTLYALPLEDTNAPDLYIPSMGIVTYILTLALFSGLKNEFHPEVFGFETSSTLAYLVLDLCILKGGLYLLNINSKAWDLICYIGYKFVPICLLLVIKNVTSSSLFRWASFLYLAGSYAFFELRAIRYNLFGGVSNTAQTLNSRSSKNANYFLFVYAFLFQSFLLWLLA